MKLYCAKGIMLFLITLILVTTAACGKKNYGTGKKKFKAWGMVPQSSKGHI